MQMRNDTEMTRARPSAYTCTYAHMRTPKQQRGYLRRGAVEASVDFHVLPGRRRALSASIRLLFVIVSFHFISKKHGPGFEVTMAGNQLRATPPQP